MIKSPANKSPNDMPGWAIVICIGAILLLPIYICIHVAIARIELRIENDARERIKDRHDTICISASAFEQATLRARDDF